MKEERGKDVKDFAALSIRLYSKKIPPTQFVKEKGTQQHYRPVPSFRFATIVAGKKEKYLLKKSREKMKQEML